MTWFSWALLSGFFYTILGLLSRYVLKNNQDSWSFSFFFSLLGAVVCLPVAIFNWQSTQEWLPWIMMFLISGLIVLHNYLNFQSTRFLPASMNGTLTKFRLIWTLALGIFILHEGFSWPKILGTALTILAGVIVVFHYQKLKTMTGVWLAISATLVYAIVAVSFKYFFHYFNVPTMTFFIFLIPALFNYLIIPQAWKRVTDFARVNGQIILIIGLMGGLANLTTNAALAGGEISRVGVVTESFLVATLAGEHFFLKEKEHLLVKIIAVILALTGVILIKL
jgi:drug/metabolite transporter (DMT)-like permease